MQDQIEGAQLELERMIEIFNYREVNEAFETFAMTCDEYNAAKVIQAVLNNSRIDPWISAEDAPPPFDDDIAILAFNGQVHECWYYTGPAHDYAHGGAADCDAFFQDSDYSRIPNVTHWMPMPEGPKL